MALLVFHYPHINFDSIETGQKYVALQVSITRVHIRQYNKRRSHGNERLLFNYTIRWLLDTSSHPPIPDIGNDFSTCTELKMSHHLHTRTTLLVTNVSNCRTSNQRHTLHVDNHFVRVTIASFVNSCKNCICTYAQVKHN